MFYRFKGEDGSLGLKKGCVYRITIDSLGANNMVIAKIEKDDTYVSCPYVSMEMFEANWEVVFTNKTKLLNIDLGNTLGITRHLDELGRVVIPKEFRKELNFNEEDVMEIFLLQNGVYIQKK